MTKEERNYDKFHAIAILMIVIIFLFKISDTDNSKKPNRDELSNKSENVIFSTTSVVHNN